MARARRAASRSWPDDRTEGLVTSSPAVKNLARRDPTTITRMSESPDTRLTMSSSSIQKLRSATSSHNRSLLIVESVGGRPMQVSNDPKSGHNK